MTDQLTKTAASDMEKNNSTVNVHNIAKAFQRFHKGLEQRQLHALEKELMNMYPSEDSEVMIFTGYDEKGNSIGVSLFVTKAIKVEEKQKMGFNQLMLEYLIRMDIERMDALNNCIRLMERKEGDQYEVDFIPVSYNKRIDKYSLHFRIIKKH